MSKVWLITGTSRGLGTALASAVLDAGDKLVATARSPEQLSDLAQRYGDQVLTVALDVTDRSAVSTAIDAAVAAFGRLDVLVNNAGYGDVGSIEDTGDAEFRAQIETNFFGVVNLTRAAIPVMREQRSGHIIQISSIAGRRGTPGFAAYQSAKWAVEGFSEALAKEVGPLGIKVTIIEPGRFRTDWSGSSMTIHSSRPEYDATVGSTARFQREHQDTQPGDPVRAAAAILYVSRMNEPPLRLLLGSDAVQVAEESDLARIQADKTWRQLSMSTDFRESGTPRESPSPFPSHFELPFTLPAECVIADQYAQYRQSEPVGVAEKPMTLKQIAKTVERALALLILLAAKESETSSQNIAVVTR